MGTAEIAIVATIFIIAVLTTAVIVMRRFDSTSPEAPPSSPLEQILEEPEQVEPVATEKQLEVEPAALAAPEPAEPGPAEPEPEVAPTGPAEPELAKPEPAEPGSPPSAPLTI